MLDYTKIYHEIAPKEAIISGALAYVRGRVGIAGAITLTDLREGCVAVVKSLAVEKLYPDFLKLVENSVAVFEMTNGERPPLDIADRTPTSALSLWEDAFDEHLLRDIGTDLQRAIGPSCIGEHFTDSDVDDEKVRTAVVREMCERLAEAAMPMDHSDPADVKPSIAKTLSAAGVVEKDLLPYCTGQAVPNGPAAPAVVDTIEARGKVEQIVGGYALRVGADAFDPLVMDELLTAAFDDDHFIAVGAIERMGGSVADAPFFLAYGHAMPNEAKGNSLSAACTALVTGQVGDMPAPAAGPKIKLTGATGARAKKGAAASNPSAPPIPPAAGPAPLPPTTPQAAAGTDNWGDVARIWREHGTDTDQVIGDAFGVSRATISNIGAGKGGRATAKPLDPSKARAIKSALTTKIEALQTAVALLS